MGVFVFLCGPDLQRSGPEKITVEASSMSKEESAPVTKCLGRL